MKADEGLGFSAIFLSAFANFIGASLGHSFGILAGFLGSMTFFFVSFAILMRTFYRREN